MFQPTKLNKHVTVSSALLTIALFCFVWPYFYSTFTQLCTTHPLHSHMHTADATDKYTSYKFYISRNFSEVLSVLVFVIALDLGLVYSVLFTVFVMSDLVDVFFFFTYTLIYLLHLSFKPKP